MSERKDNLWLAAHFIFTMVASLIALKFNIMNFGSHIFGVWVLLSSIWGLSNVIDLGFGLALIRAVSKNRDDRKALSQVTSTGFVFFILFGLVILAIGMFIGNNFYVNDTTLVQPELKQSSFNTNLILGGFFYLNYISTFFRSVYEGLGLFIFYSKIAIVYSALTLTAAITSWAFRLDISGLALLMLLAALLQLGMLFSLGMIRKKFTSLLSFRFNRTVFKELFSFSISVQGATVLGTAIDPVIKYIIGSNMDVKVVGFYDIAKRFAQASSGLFFAAFRTIYPKASRIQPGEEKEFILNECLPLSKKGILTAGLFFMAFTPVFAAIFVFFYGSPVSFNIFLLLAMVESVNLFGYSYYSTLMGNGKANFLALVQFINLTGVAALLTLGIRLTNSYTGLAGYALTVITVNYLMLTYIRKFTNISRSGFFLNAGGIRLILQFTVLVCAFVVLELFAVNPFYIAGGLLLAWLIIYGSAVKSYTVLLTNLIKREG
ncbi:MAG: oligosaccharide flippase family protein [Ignavibacteriales bacterium]|nr:MAG: oligosaccharide flippase family protein [Ignavibacteriaceae bacterium]MBW7873899.1 oligosaccharide flippase family protein [Ignavibacteria bacterium]MCZ2143342.1 oligosaccharide flippase family protein [Ignavibacteriales bacterium]OQY77607.1 MAG: hypothetical protein B6D45_02595 [Ignavibacteriales bacterium UTCHB3]MBV6444223.1 hypothetical protein [Ignavibacteriaceae bacterium]